MLTLYFFCRKVLEADLHNKNLMDLVSKKDESVESHQVQYWTPLCAMVSAIPAG